MAAFTDGQGKYFLEGGSGGQGLLVVSETVDLVWNRCEGPG